MAQSRRAAKRQIEVKRVLVPTDFSPGAEPALRWAAALAEAFGADMVLLHVLDVRLAALADIPPDMVPMPALDQLLHSTRTEAEQQMHVLGTRFRDARTIIKEGAARSVIL